ncbi:hypothetical protein M9H77_05583 [Catharanthus roseus]|uniref:Uncharacterized protein n=1 Tax=Catharanthus roseus TaxID=4058 RepID=A0ACC0CHG4_CATRO|nr:hypothetical protein M9H77_05583 [Catharanthus roseus]
MICKKRYETQSKKNENGSSTHLECENELFLRWQVDKIVTNSRVETFCDGWNWTSEWTRTSNLTVFSCLTHRAKSLVYRVLIRLSDTQVEDINHGDSADSAD